MFRLLRWCAAHTVMHAKHTLLTHSNRQVRSAGVFASLFMSSVLLRENVFALIIAQARARCSYLCGLV